MMRDRLMILWVRLKPAGFWDLVTPVLVVAASFWLTDFLQSRGVIANVSSQLFAAVVGCVICWAIAAAAIPRPEYEERLREGEEKRG